MKSSCGIVCGILGCMVTDRSITMPVVHGDCICNYLYMFSVYLTGKLVYCVLNV